MHTANVRGGNWYMGANGQAIVNFFFGGDEGSPTVAPFNVPNGIPDSHMPSMTQGDPNAETDVAGPTTTTRADHEIYYHQLLVKKRGAPLWQPGPNMRLPVEYRQTGVSIGDVCIIDIAHGRFDFLFNIFLDSGHPIQRGGVPEGFCPLRPTQVESDIEESIIYGANSYLASSTLCKTSGVNSSGLMFETSAREAAILIMPDGAVTHNVLNDQSVQEYFARNAESWYNYAIVARERTVRNGDIRVVIGCDKVTSWGIATLSSNIEQIARFEFKGNGGGSASQPYSWDCSGSCGGSGRVGPHAVEIRSLRSETDTTPLQNQCVFVRTMNLIFAMGENCAKAASVLNQMAPVSECQPRPQHDGSSNIQSTSSARGLQPSHIHISSNTTGSGVSVVHPSTFLNKALLEKYPNARMVITQDTDWTNVIAENDTTIPDPQELCARVLEVQDLCEMDGVVTLIPKSKKGRVLARIPVTDVTETAPSLGPGVDTGHNPAVAAYCATQNVKNVKLYKTQCQHLGDRCVQFRSTIQESTKALEGTFVTEFADELDSVLRHINRHMQEWASWNHLRSFLQKGDIKGGIDRMDRELDYCMTRFNVRINLELNAIHERDTSEIRDMLDKIVKVHDDLNHLMRDRGQIDLMAIQKQDECEIRQVLQTIIKSEDAMKALLDESAPAVEELMGTLQTQLMAAELKPAEEEDFKAALWDLYEKTARLPPLTDLSGQITLTSQEPVSMGSSNKIFHGLWLNQQKVALCLPRASGNSPMVNYCFKREVTIWRGLHHPNVVPLYGTVKIEEDIYSVIPWRHNDILSEYVRKDLAVDRLKLLSEIASGLEYLHKHGIIHGNLRGANVLVSTDGVACLSHLGLSNTFEDMETSLDQDRSSSSSSLRWTAPEVLTRDSAVSRYSDTWSFGMICLEVLSVQEPFYGQDDRTVLRQLSHGKHPDRPSNMRTGLHSDIWDLMLRCWTENPKNRPSMSYVAILLEQEFRNLELLLDQPTTSSTRLPLGFGRRTSTIGSSPYGVGAIRRPLTPGSSSHSGSQTSTADSYDTKSSSTTMASAYSSIPPTPSTVSGSPKSYSSGDPPRLELGVLLHSSPLSVDSRRLSAIQEATLSPHLMLNILDDVVESGTLESLVQHLIKHFDSRKHADYRDVFLMACPEFTTPDELPNYHRLFFDAEDDRNVEMRVETQYNTFLVLDYWLKLGYFAPNQELLYRMKFFCEMAMRLKLSITLIERINVLLQVVESKISEQRVSPHSLCDPRARTLRSSDLEPRGLAIALTLLEGDNYKALQPPDYIIHFAHDRSDNMSKVYETNNRIIAWVTESILHYDDLQKRVQVLRFFIHTALECRKMRNFSSTIAIATALQCPGIENLKVTMKALTRAMQEKLSALYDIVNPEYNHHRYREALGTTATPEERDTCIPCLAIHFKELEKTLHQNLPTIKVDGRQLINFKRYVRFMERIKEVNHYSPPDLEEQRDGGQLEYLLRQLRSVDTSEASKDRMLERSVYLMEKEVADHCSRKDQ